MTETAPEYDFFAKIIMIGESRAGKSSIWRRYCDIEMCCSSGCTMGIDFKIKTIEVNGKRAKLQIWDTAGQERFMTLTRSYYHRAHGVLLCYAIDNRESFEKIEYWLEEVRKNASEKDICIVLVGTKSDLSNERVVNYDEGIKLAEKHGLKFFETSAKNNVKIDEAFLTVVRDISEIIGKEKSCAKPVSQMNLRQNKSRFNCFQCY